MTLTAAQRRACEVVARPFALAVLARLEAQAAAPATDPATRREIGALLRQVRAKRLTDIIEILEEIDALTPERHDYD